jgi:phospholipase/carboxylesterase
MRDVPDLLPVRPGLTALGGFSQGGTMSLAHALMFSGSVTHVLNLSGFLANHPLVRLDPEALAAVRIFWGHGTHDPAIPHEMAVAGRAKLAAAGADLTARDYPMGHTIDPRELTDVTQWLGEGATSSPSTGDR